MKLRDIFLLPKEFYRRLDDSRLTLYIGTLLVGMRNIGFYLWSSREDYAPIRFQDIILGNLAVVLGFVVLIGLLDVIFFSYPAFDLLKLMKRREENPVVQTTVIRMMKVYILANLIVTPADFMLTYIVSIINLETISYSMGLLLTALALIYLFWYFAVIARGSVTIFNFKNAQMMFVLIFILAVAYNHLLNYAYEFIYEKGLIALLK